MKYLLIAVLSAMLIFTSYRVSYLTSSLDSYKEVQRTIITDLNAALDRANIAEAKLEERKYLVSYVYHTKENGPVAGYGFMEVDRIPTMRELWMKAIVNESTARKGKRQEHIRSLSFLSINKL